ncbi:SLBB domain-containing protein, partial [Myxococcota bacterium]|nr:SLBB domain-containing protein [Myxococcota bacterium]
AAWSDLAVLRAGFEGAPPFTVLREVLVSALPGEIWREVQRSQLSGRGGAHFPVATKWQHARKHAGPRRLVINGQEGEPETFKDHLLMLKEPHLVVEGAAIAAFALEAERVHIVVDPHAERELAAMERALADLVAAFGSDAASRFELVRGPGRYVAGEESALLEHLEGHRVEPRLRPPFPAEKGLFGRPTVIHNVETITWLPSIVRGGGEAFAARGPLVLASLSGAVARPGVYPVPIGTTLEALLALGGGVAPGKSLLAFGVGGPAGGLLPPSAASTPLRDAELAAAGALLGTGAVRVFDTTECLVHAVLETLAFFERESCGRCAPCRVGTQVLRRTWADVAAHGPHSERLRMIDATGAALVGGSFCGLGRGVPKRLESLRRYWPELVAAHGEREECPSCRSAS